MEQSADGGRHVRLLPVLLPGLPRKPRLPAFLRPLDHVDLRQGGVQNKEEIRQLVRSILATTTY